MSSVTTLALSTIMEALLVYGLVTCCALYTGWALAPAGLRRAFAIRLLARKLVLPSRLTALLRAAASTQGACGCDGCPSAGNGSSKETLAADGSKPIRFVKNSRSRDV